MTVWKRSYILDVEYMFLERFLEINTSSLNEIEQSMLTRSSRG